jgi:hypothetical protein
MSKQKTISNFEKLPLTEKISAFEEMRQILNEWLEQEKLRLQLQADDYAKIQEAIKKS